MAEMNSGLYDQLNRMSDEELQALANGASAPTRSLEDEMKDMPDWRLKELSGEYSQYDYQLPSDTMYDQITGDNPEEQANALYEKFANSPYSGDSWKGKTYKGILIPKPNYSLNASMAQFGEALSKVNPIVAGVRKILPDQHMQDNPVTVSAPQIAIDAVSDVPGEVAEFGASVADKAASWIGWNTNMTGTVQKFQEENLPKMRVESMSGKFTKEAAQMAVGGGAAMKVLKVAGPAYQLLGTVIGGAITRDDQTSETLLFGENSLLGADLKGFSDKTKASEVLNRRLNLLADDAVVGVLGEGLVRGGVFLGKTMYGVTVGRALPYLNKGKRELKVMQHIAGMLRLADDAQTTEEQKRILTDLANYMADPDNQKIIYKIPDPEINDIAVKLDSMSILRRSGDMTSDVTKDNASILSRKGDQMGGVAEATDNLTKNVMDSLGRNKPEQAKAIVKDITDSRVGNAYDEIISAEQGLTAARQDLKKRLTNDPTFGETLQKVGRQFDILADDVVYKNTEELTDKVINAFVDSQKKLRGLSETVKRAGGNINMPDMDRIKSLVEDAGSQSDISRGLKTVMERSGNKAIDWATEVRPMLSAEISRIYKTGSKSNADANFLRAIRDEIDSQLDVLAGSDGVRKSAAGKAYQEFHTYFKEKYAPVWSDGILGDVSEKLKDSPLIRFGRPDVNTLEGVDKAIADRLPEFRSARQFVENMRNEGQDVDSIKDYIIGKAVREVRGKIKPGSDIEEFPIGLLSEKLADYGAAFKESDPQLADGINQFLRDIQSGATDINQMKEVIKQLQDESVRLEQSLKGKGGTFEDFFTSAKDPENSAVKFRVVDDASEAIQNIFKDKKSAKTKIENLLKETSIGGENDPTILAGLQVAWVDSLRREIIDKSTGMFNVRGSKLLLDDETVTSFLTLGKEVFKDKPELFELHKTILRDALDESQSLSKQLKTALSSQSVDTDIANAAHILTTWTFGVLNRTAARVRSGVGGYLSINRKAGSVDEIYHQLLNDPAYFSDVLKRLANSTKKGVMSKETKEILWDVMTRVHVPLQDTNQPDNMDKKRLFNELLADIQTDLALKNGQQ